MKRLKFAVVGKISGSSGRYALVGQVAQAKPEHALFLTD
jgi:hypothetical protein